MERNHGNLSVIFFLIAVFVHKLIQFTSSQFKRQFETVTKKSKSKKKFLMDKH